MKWAVIPIKESAESFELQMSVVMVTLLAVLRASLIIAMFLSHKVAIPSVSFLLSGTVASGLRDLTYLSMFGSWTAETGSVEPPIQKARSLSDFSCFSLDQSSSCNVRSNLVQFLTNKIPFPSSSWRLLPQSNCHQERWRKWTHWTHA